MEHWRRRSPSVRRPAHRKVGASSHQEIPEPHNDRPPRQETGVEGFLLLGADEPNVHSLASNRRMISHEVSGSVPTARVPAHWPRSARQSGAGERTGSAGQIMRSAASFLLPDQEACISPETVRRPRRYPSGRPCRTRCPGSSFPLLPPDGHRAARRNRSATACCPPGFAEDAPARKRARWNSIRLPANLSARRPSPPSGSLRPVRPSANPPGRKTPLRAGWSRQ